MPDSFHTPSYKHHIKASLILGLPLVASQMAQMLVNVTDTVMLGWLGTNELAAGVLAAQTFFFFSIFGLGFGAAMVPLIANAMGRNDAASVRRATRMGLWALLGLSLMLMIPLWFTADLLIALGQNVHLAQLAETYMRIAQWALIPLFILNGLRSFLISLEKANAVLLISLGAAVINGFLNYALIFGNWGAPRLGIEGAAYATVIVNTISVLASLAYILMSDATKTYYLFARFWHPRWQYLKDISRLGFPISFSIVAEAGMFSAASVLIGWIGTVELAAHGIVLQWTSLTFMIPLGFSQAVSARIGNAAGRNDAVAIGRAGNAIVSLSMIIAVVTATIFFVMPEYLTVLFISPDNTDLELLLYHAVPLLTLAGAFQVCDAAQISLSGSLRGLQDTNMPMVIAFISYWGVGLPCSYLLAIHYGLGATGVWGGLVVGFGISSMALARRFARREELGLLPIASQ